MKTLICLLLFALMSTSLFAQPKEQPGRYQIFRVSSLSKNLHDAKVAGLGVDGSEDVLLLDTQTGKTWILNQNLNFNPTLSQVKFDWVQLTYTDMLTLTEDETLLPPKEEKKK